MLFFMAYGSRLVFDGAKLCLFVFCLLHFENILLTFENKMHVLTCKIYGFNLYLRVFCPICE